MNEIYVNLIWLDVIHVNLILLDAVFAKLKIIWLTWCNTCVSSKIVIIASNECELCANNCSTCKFNGIDCKLCTCIIFESNGCKFDMIGYYINEININYCSWYKISTIGYNTCKLNWIIWILCKHDTMTFNAWKFVKIGHVN